MHKIYLKIAVFLGALSVAMGAFAAHGLKKIVAEKSVAVFQTGVQYQMYHVFALLATGILYQFFQNKFITNAGKFFILGIILFSGSLYVLTFSEVLHSTAFSWIVFVTPLGGVTFIIGWLLLFLGIRK